MKTLVWLGLAASLVVPAWAQRGAGYGRIGGREFGFGFGSVVFPGGMPTAPRHPFSVTDPGFASRLGGIVSATRPYTGGPQGGFGPARSPAVVIPYAVPVFVGGGYPYYNEYAAPQPNVIVVSPQQPTAPQVIINQNFAAQPEPTGSSVQVYQAPSPAAVDAAAPQEPTIYLIAFNDSSVRTAIAYWVEGDTLHYVTPQGQPNKASLTLIDREFSRKLNSQRNIDFNF